MRSPIIRPSSIRIETENWPLAAPFRTAAHTVHAIDVVLVNLEKDGHVGRGEAAGVFYRHERAASMVAQLQSVRHLIEAGLSRDSLQRILPPGGARNALDCALWDLEAKLQGRPAWQIAELETPRPLVTTFTCGADEPERMAQIARGYIHARAIKLKLTGEPIDADRIRAVREALSDVWLGVDANQGFTRDFLERLLPTFIDTRVALIEQPFPVGQDSLLDGLHSPIPIAADESLQSLEDLADLVGHFDVVNIKLDKCGGLTQGLAIARAAHSFGLDTMVGNMLGTSLAMAPAYLVGQLCSVVDLDGPVFLKHDRAQPVHYVDGSISCPESLWG